jgi:protein subunit release factor A
MKKDYILEIRAGEGGDDSKLFAKDMYKMYTEYCGVASVNLGLECL